MTELDDLKLAVAPVVMNWDITLRGPMALHNWETIAGQMRGMADKIDRVAKRGCKACRDGGSRHADNCEVA